MKAAIRGNVFAVVLTAGFIITMLFCAHTIKSGKNKKSEVTAPKKHGTSIQEPITKVVIDPGHGGFDGGAAGNKTGVTEDAINLKISLLVKEYLEQKNVEVILTRQTDDAIAPTKNEDMRKRRSIMHESGASLTVSIHLNKYSDTSISGPMVFYTKGDEPSKQLAQMLINDICAATERSPRLANPGDYFVIRNSKIPAVIVECGFLSNATEEALLCKSDYQNKLAIGITNGIFSFITQQIQSSSLAMP